MKSMWSVEKSVIKLLALFKRLPIIANLGRSSSRNWSWASPSPSRRLCLPRSPASKARDGSAAIADRKLAIGGVHSRTRIDWIVLDLASAGATHQATNWVARPTGSSLSPSTYFSSTPRSCAPPRVSLATLLCDFATNRREERVRYRGTMEPLTCLGLLARVQRLMLCRASGLWGSNDGN
jgi:hypothetical protein